MILILDGATSLQTSYLEYLYAKDVEVAVHSSFPQSLSSVVYDKNKLQIFLSYPQVTTDEAEDRHTALYLAGQGARYWGPSLDENHPVYAGDLPETPEDLDAVVVDLNYSKARKDLIDSFGVQYTGRTYSSPKTLIILDAKRKINAHDPAENEALYHFLASVPEDFWQTAALVSSASQKKLEWFLAEHDQSIPVVTSTGTAAKLKFAGLDYVEASLPSETSREYGVKLRASVTLFERQ